MAARENYVLPTIELEFERLTRPKIGEKPEVNIVYDFDLQISIKKRRARDDYRKCKLADIARQMENRTPRR